MGARESDVGQSLGCGRRDSFHLYEMKSRTHTEVEEGLAKRPAVKPFVAHLSNSL